MRASQAEGTEGKGPESGQKFAVSAYNRGARVLGGSKSRPKGER